MVIRRGDPDVLRLVVIFLRSVADMTQAEFARRSRLSQPAVSRFEAGKDVPSEAELQRMARAAAVEWPVVVQLTRFFTVVLDAVRRDWARAEPDAAQLDSAVLDAMLLAVAPYLLEETAAEHRQPSLEKEHREAEEIWPALEVYPLPRRRELIELAPPKARSCALVARVCDASERAATHEPTEALELAGFARFIAERVIGGEERRARALGYALGFIANAQRVANDFGTAEATFRHVWEQWQAGATIDFDPLAEWRLLDLEASLRREQHRFYEALELLDRARSACGGDPLATARILMKKSHVLERQGDFAGALAALEEAAPAITVSGDPRLLFGLFFNQATNLSHLERHGEAAALLAKAKELDVRQVNELSSLRVLWLEARVNSTQGKAEEAMAALEQVRGDFTARELPYDAALASLDLAVLWLERGRTAEVRELSVDMGWIFKTKGIDREALASLTLFCEAARQDAVSVELTQQVIAEIEKVRRSTPCSGA